ncbi:MAG TPA: hypothetical protein VNJ06_09280 [Gemmatimonadales bacterium]|nr:hypothetical protein [Gemmatimonadales bacterium]
MTKTVTEAGLYTRVTRRVIPLLFACYVAAYLDRALAGVMAIGSMPVLTIPARIVNR